MGFCDVFVPRVAEIRNIFERAKGFLGKNIKNNV